MSYGRFKGGKHFSKKAINGWNQSISDAQIRQLKSFGYTNEMELKKLSYDQASFVLKELRRKGINE